MPCCCALKFIRYFYTTNLFGSVTLPNYIMGGMICRNASVRKSKSKHLYCTYNLNELGIITRILIVKKECMPC